MAENPFLDFEPTPGIYRCRACKTLNDFDGQERVENEKMPAGEFCMMAEYRCIACGFAVSVEPWWFVVPKGEQPVFIESGFEWVKL